jgi:hypothetical protein
MTCCTAPFPSFRDSTHPAFPLYSLPAHHDEMTLRIYAIS